jgi:hypothetical protein
LTFLKREDTKLAVSLRKKCLQPGHYPKAAGDAKLSGPMNGKTSVQLTAYFVLLLALVTPCFAASPTIWTGPMISFSQAGGSNPSLAANQDRITSDIWITRNTTLGLYNAFDESSFTHFFSPQGTEWATGSLANYASLSYTDWNTWAKNINGGPPNTVGINAVLYLVPDNIYLAIKFTSWGETGAGGFSYMRSTPGVVPEPATTGLVMAGFLLAVVSAKRRA